MTAWFDGEKSELLILVDNMLLFDMHGNEFGYIEAGTRSKTVVCGIGIKKLCAVWREAWWIDFV